ncbi:hypothetical protein V6R21_05540 [Limibacter armeniacum]|uniref:hypothetical protein n=1 Tax=Limibacter armeniacum TaxID=466084 RepID=UPI002FE696B5
MKRIFLAISLLPVLWAFSPSQNVQVAIFEQLSIDVPSTFSQLDPEVLDEKYHDQPFHPVLELHQEQDSITLILSDNLNPLSEGEVDNLREFYENHFKGMYPNAVWLDTKTVDINSLPVAYLETSNQGEYYLVFFTAVDGRQIHIAISAKSENLDRVRETSRGIMESLKKRG